jgi:hypothetical protein
MSLRSDAVEYATRNPVSECQTVMPCSAEVVAITFPLSVGATVPIEMLNEPGKITVEGTTVALGRSRAGL